MKQMQWLNEPDHWKIDGDTLEMSVTGKTDFWRKTHYGFDHIWVKAGIEYVDGVQNVSAVVTHGHSDWSIISLDSAPQSVWIKAVRRLLTIKVSYSLDGSD